MEKITDLNIYKMLSDEVRLKILKMLSIQNMAVGEIVEKTGMDQPLISHKLKELRENGLTLSYRSGKSIIYSLSSDSLKEVISVVESAGNKIDYVCNCVECKEND
ncbi:MAG: metalloregulator ArsR/SmtB family transcription factor [Ferroplasma sp.]|uniref:ArsR/SmtB family transcription factor n=1 Tax=Ferroplasma sp. TaxID=2591003 RepID=UPI0028155C0D|nr:metalloregulator ArsR/SmtB family transcription factor [Ferroplasma sp.]WMT51522.1 MAG: metalloregulator ArsR/SmtB family transcription factor [Ferroplasma sp.]